MPVNDELGKRMKTYYEAIPKTKLMRKVPVAIRIDGRAFHTFTRGFRKPFDEVLIKSMQETMKYLCENIQGCVLGYTQSDEITLILVDYQRLGTSAWFDYEVQKICSIAASMATMAFNKFFYKNIDDYSNTESVLASLYGDDEANKEEIRVYLSVLHRALKKGAMFDARCFNIPKEEVTNLIYWRQLDAARNSVQMVGQANFSHRELQGKNCSQIQDMLMLQKGINWNNFPVYQKRGSCCVKECYTINSPNNSNEPVVRSRWAIDDDIPIFKGNNREYIEQRINF